MAMRRLLHNFCLLLKSPNHTKILQKGLSCSSDSTSSSINDALEPHHIGNFGQPDFSTHPHLLQHGDVTTGLQRGEYQKRRENLMQLILSNSPKTSENHIAIIPSATKQYMSADIPYTFRQNTDFSYLSGFKEPDSFLVLENKPGKYSSEVKSTLFVPKKDAKMELWDGPRSGAYGSLVLTGVDQAYNSNELDVYINDYKHNTNVCVWYDSEKPNNQRFHQRIVDNVLMRNWVEKVERLRPLIHELRVIKSESECEIMEHTCEITSDGFREVMRYAAPESDESFLDALMEYQCRIRGAQRLAYPPVVASGSRANIIHYINNDAMLKENDLVLMDAGCEWNGYNSDVTRTFPARGDFDTQQCVLYEALLWLQEQLIVHCIPGNCISGLYNNMMVLLGRQLRELGIVPKYVEGDELLNLVKRYCPHDVGHYLGMDIHDTPSISRHRPLEPGMVITVEPGLYIPESDTAVPTEWRGVGMRIEDNVLISEYLPKNLTVLCPKTVAEIEQAMDRNF